MHYVLDGYNYLFWSGRSSGSNSSDPWSENSSLQKVRNEIIDELSEIAESSGLKLQLVFDAAHTPGSAIFDRYCPIEVLYSPQGMSADDWMIEYANNHKKAFAIVTNDKRLKRNLLDLRALTLSFEEFNQRVENKKRTKTRLTAADNSLASDKRREERLKKALPGQAIRSAYCSLFEDRYLELYGEASPLAPPKENRNSRSLSAHSLEKKVLQKELFQGEKQEPKKR